MKFSINLSGKNIYTWMREFGYAPAQSSQNRANESVYYRVLRGGRYPRFHIYAVMSEDKKTATFNLHLDQKQPSYKGTHAHGGEYDGLVVETEAARIQSFVR